MRVGPLAILLASLIGCSSESSRRNGEVQLAPGPSAPVATTTATSKGAPKLVQISRTEGAGFTALEEAKWVVTSPKGDRSASGGGTSGAILLWDGKGRSLGALVGADVLVAAFSPDGKRLAAVVPREGMVLFDVEARTRIHVEPRTGGTIFALAFSPDGGRIVTSDGDGTVELWSADGKTPRKKLAQYTEFSDVAFSPDSRSVLIAGDATTLDRWDLASSTKTPLVPRKAGFRHVAYSADGKTILTAELDAKDNVVRLRDASTGAIKQTMRGHTSFINAIAFSPDGRSVASGSGDGTVRLWETATGKELRRLSTNGKAIWALGFDATGERILAAGQTRSVHAWTSANGEPVKVGDGHAAAISSLAYAPDGATLLSGDGDGQIFLHAAGGGEARRVMKLDRGVRSMNFSADGATLRTVSQAGLQLWDAKDRTALRSVPLDRLSAVVFSPNETEFTVGNESRVVTLRHASDGSVIRSFGEAQPHDGMRQNLMTPSSVAFSPDGTMIAIARWDQPVELWERETGRRIRALEGTLSVAFSPDGSRIATGDGTVSKRGGPLSLKLVNVATGTVEHTLDGEPEAMFLPGGAYVLGTRGGELRVWNVATGRLETSTPAHRVLAFAVSRDGARVATGGLDGAVTEWKIWGE